MKSMASKIRQRRKMYRRTGQGLDALNALEQQHRDMHNAYWYEHRFAYYK